MVESETSSIKTNVIAGLITASIVGAISFIPGLWAWVWAIILSSWSDFWAHIKSTHEVPSWMLYLLTIPTLRWLYQIALSTYDGLTSKEPRQSSYVQDRFFGVTWRWHYVSGHPSGIWAFCPACDTQLVYSFSYESLQQTIHLHCETCRHDLLRETGDKDYLVAKAHRQIDRKLRNGEWRSVVLANQTTS